MVTLNDIYSVKPIGSFGFTPFTTNEWPRTLPKNRLFPNQRLVCFKFAERAFTFGGKKWEDKKWLSSLSASNMQETTRCERVAQMPQGVEKEMPKKYDVHVDQQDENQQDDNQQDER